MDSCIFCRIVKGELPCFKVFGDQRVLAFMDINPIAEGHTLVIPRAHAENIWEISPEDLAAVQAASQRLAGALRQVLQPVGIACLQLNGRGVNQVVMHYHQHLIPRRASDPQLGMTAWELVPGNMAAIAQTAARLAEAVR
jgi:histidine triad (HIT) family protein